MREICFTPPKYAKPQCKHLDFENFGGVSFPNSNYWFYIIFSQGS